MYTVMKDSLIEPKKILNHRNKSLFFVFMYLLLLSLLMSLGTFVFYLGYKDNTVITSQDSGCEISSGALTCSGDNYDGSNEYNLYGVAIYILDSSDSLTSFSTLATEYMVIQGTTLSIFSGQKLYFSGSIGPILETSASFDVFIHSFQTVLLVGFLIIGVLSNIVIILLFVLISTLPFLIFRKFIKYKKIFTLAAFASTPVAFVMTFYGLLNLSDIIFLVLLFISYRSLFILRKELTYQIFLHSNPVKTENKEEDDSKGSDAEFTIHDAEDLPSEEDDDDKKHPKE